MSLERINVTQAFLPPLEEYVEYLQGIWSRVHLTNHGPLLQEFERQVEEYLGVHQLHLVSNGTLALQVALRALDVTAGEIITTPFSYVATTSSILWERCRPVFVDIEPKTFCIDADKIEAAITEKTKAIMAVHVFGNPCDVEKIEAIAKKHKLKTIYDGAHAFGVRHKGRALLSYGDIATCSFHATKLFHTIEGGCIVARDKSVSDNVRHTRSFGHQGDDHKMLGINAKASEFQAAMGLCNLKYVDSLIQKRKKIFELYNKLLKGHFQTPIIADNTEHNYSYYPILLDDEGALLGMVQRLQKHNIYPRRYFYPSLNKLPYLNSEQDCPVSEGIARRILCLPLYPGLGNQTVAKICGIMNA